MPLSRVLFDSYQEVPDQVAIHFLDANQPDRAIPFSRLFEGAAGVAIALKERNVQPGDVVILILTHSEALIYAFWGAVLAGAVPSIMPFQTEKLSPEHYRASLATLFEITAPAAVITSSDFLSDVQLAAVNASSLRVVLLSEEIQSSPATEQSFFPGLTRSPEEVVLLQHSSGTTGLQKGVALSHLAVINQLRSYTDALHLDQADVIVSWLPLYHDMGLIAGFLLPILSRTPLVLMSPFDWVRAPYRLFTAVTRYRGTLVWLPNFAYNFCAQKIRERELAGVDLSSLRAVINCSEPMVWASHQLFLQRFMPYGFKPEALATCYAMAENVFAVTQGGIDSPVFVDEVSRSGLLDERVARPAGDNEISVPMLSAGKTIKNTRVRILDEKRNTLPDRHVGEIAILSDCMLTGYYHRPDITTQSFHEGWYLTGDLGYLSQEEVFVIGRKKEMIIVGGKNIYPQDIERLIEGIPGIHPGRVVAFGVFNDTAGTEDVIVVAEMDDLQDDNTWKETSAQAADQIRQQVTRGSDITLRQVRIVRRGWLLKTSSGKIARQANRDKYLAERSQT